MGLVINHNMMAMTAARNLSNGYAALATSTQRLSSGLRVASEATSQQSTGTAAAQPPSGETVASGGAEQAKGALLNISDGGSGLVKNVNTAIIDQPNPLQAQSNALASHPVAPTMSNSRSVDNAILSLMK